MGTEPSPDLARVLEIIRARLAASEEYSRKLSIELGGLRDEVALLVREHIAGRMAAEAMAEQLATDVESTRSDLAAETETARAAIASATEIRKGQLEHLLSDKLFRTRRNALAFGLGYALLGFAIRQLLEYVG